MTAVAERLSVALFGSMARGDGDAYSDRDLLVVADSQATLKAKKATYEAVGWSCTAYSWDRLQNAADQGSLFVQHLKQEARIILDSSEKLRELLTLFSAKKSYTTEFDSSFSLLGNLVQFLPNCRAGPMWTLDILSVGFRSLAVTKLANDGIYAFSNGEIIHGLIRKGIITKSEGTRLDHLRRFKSMYRRGLANGNMDWQETFEYIRIMDRAFLSGINI